MMEIMTAEPQGYSHQTNLADRLQLKITKSQIAPSMEKMQFEAREVSTGEDVVLDPSQKVPLGVLVEVRKCVICFL
jgi:hypothetical protein